MKIYRLDAVNGSPVPIAGALYAGGVALHDNGTYAWFTTMSTHAPLPDVGRYSIDGSNLSVTTSGGVLVTGLITDKLIIVKPSDSDGTLTFTREL